VHTVRVGDWVRLRESQYGTAQGPSDKHGDGRPWEVPSGAVCEVISVDGTTGWLTLHFDLDDSGAHEPYRVEVIVEPDDVDPAEPPPLQGLGWGDARAPRPWNSSAGSSSLSPEKCFWIHSRPSATAAGSRDADPTKRFDPGGA